MTDYSKLKTIDELDYQLHRLKRREAIQRARLQGHVDFVIRQYNFVVDTIDSVVSPVRKKIKEYSDTAKSVIRIIKAFLPKKK